MSGYHITRVDRDQAAFTDERADLVLEGLRNRLDGLERDQTIIRQRYHTLKAATQEALVEFDEKTEQIAAIEFAIIEYDRARYSRKHNPHTKKEAP